MTTPTAPRVNILVSYAALAAPAYIESLVLPLAARVDVIIDSGGFTLRMADLTGTTPPAHINVEDYSQTCRGLDGKVWGYVQLDRPMDEDTTMAWLRHQREAGLSPIPVWVSNGSEECVQELFDGAPQNRVCVAGGAGAKTNNEGFTRWRYHRIHELTGGAVKTHALGFGRWPQMMQLPIATVDTSSFSMGGRYGRVLVFHPRIGVSGCGSNEIRKVAGVATAAGPITDPAPFRARKKKDVATQAVHRVFARVGITQDDLENDKRWMGTFSVPRMLSALAYIEMTYYLAMRGLKYFIAVTTMEELMVIAVWIRMHAAGISDWHKAEAECQAMLALRRSNFPAFVDELVDAISQPIIPTYDGIREVTAP